MDATQFIKEHGIKKAREVVATYHGIPYYTFKEKTGGYSACQSVDLSELKRLVESVDLVESLNGVETAKRYLEENMECPDFKLLKQAITDYESIYLGAES